MKKANQAVVLGLASESISELSKFFKNPKQKRIVTKSLESYKGKLSKHGFDCEGCSEKVTNLKELAVLAVYPVTEKSGIICAHLTCKNPLEVDVLGVDLDEN